MALQNAQEPFPQRRQYSPSAVQRCCLNRETRRTNCFRNGRRTTAAEGRKEHSSCGDVATSHHHTAASSSAPSATDTSLSSPCLISQKSQNLPEFGLNLGIGCHSFCQYDRTTSLRRPALQLREGHGKARQKLNRVVNCGFLHTQQLLLQDLHHFRASRYPV